MNHKYTFGLTILLCLFIFSANGAFGKDDDYMELLKSDDHRIRVNALKIIERSVVDQSEVFSFINDKLERQDYRNSQDRTLIDEMAWMCKALLSSGNIQYLGTVEKVISNTSNRKLQSYCMQAKDNFNKYAKIRQILSQPPIEGFSEEMSKNIYMLQSMEAQQVHYAVDNIIKSVESNEAVYDIVRDVMLKEAKKIGGDTTQVSGLKSLIYMCKLLGRSGYPKYIEDLEKVRHLTLSIKLEQNAQEAIYNLTQ